MTSGLQHKGTAKIIPALYQIPLLFHHGASLQRRESIVNNAGWLPHGVGIYGLDAVLVLLQLGCKGHGRLLSRFSCILFPFIENVDENGNFLHYNLIIDTHAPFVKFRFLSLSMSISCVFRSADFISFPIPKKTLFHHLYMKNRPFWPMASRRIRCIFVSGTLTGAY